QPGRRAIVALVTAAALATTTVAAWPRSHPDTLCLSAAAHACQPADIESVATVHTGSRAVAIGGAVAGAIALVYGWREALAARAENSARSHGSLVAAEQNVDVSALWRRGHEGIRIPLGKLGAWSLRAW